MSVCGTVAVNSRIEDFLVTRIVYVASTRGLQLLVITRFYLRRIGKTSCRIYLTGLTYYLKVDLSTQKHLLISPPIADNDLTAVQEY